MGKEDRDEDGVDANCPPSMTILTVLPVYLYNITCPLLGTAYGEMGTEDRDEDGVDANCPPSMTILTVLPVYLYNFYLSSIRYGVRGNGNRGQRQGQS